MIKVPCAFFNLSEIKKIGSETIFIASLIINKREIERCAFFFSKGALEEFAKYLEVSLKNEIAKKNSAQVKETNS